MVRIPAQPISVGRAGATAEGPAGLLPALFQGREALADRHGAAGRRHRRRRDRAVQLHGLDHRLARHRRPRHLPRDGRLEAGPDGGVPARRAAVAADLRHAHHPPDADRQPAAAHPLDGASLPLAPVDELLPGRVRRPHRRQADADGACRARSGDEAARRHGVRRRLFRRRGGAGGDERHLARRAVRRLAHRLRGAALLLRAQARQGRRGAGRRPLADDRAHRRQLHQYRHGEALLALAPRGVLRARGHGSVHGHRAQADAACSPCCRSSFR